MAGCSGAEEGDPHVIPGWFLADLLDANSFTERLGAQEEKLVVLERGERGERSDEFGLGHV